MEIKTVIVDTELKIKNIENFLQDSRLTKVIDAAKDNDLVLFIGLTGVGKSTCISYLLGAKIDVEEDKYGGKIAALSKNQEEKNVDKKFPEIGTLIHRSCTRFGEVFFDADLQILYGDTPGFMDSRYDESSRECASLSMQLMVQSAKNIKAICLVIEWDVFQRKIFFDVDSLMFLLGKLLIPPYSKDSLIFLINKVPTGRNMSQFKLLFEDYCEEFNKKIILAGHNLKTSSMDSAENSRLNKIALILDLLEYQFSNQTGNIILMDVFDDGEKRKIIHQLLMNKKTPIPKDKFNFKTYDESRQCFDAELDNLADKGSALINNCFSLYAKKEELERSQGNTKDNEAYYAALNNFLKANDEAVFSCMKARFIELTKKEINRLAKEKIDLRNKISELEDKNKICLKAKTSLDTSESALVYEEDFYELIKPVLMDWEWSKMINRTEKRFIYPLKVPFLNYTVSGNGSFTEHKNIPENGVCEIDYMSCFGENSKASFKIFTEKKLIPSNALRLSQIAIDVPKNNKKIKLNQDKLIALESEENGLSDLLIETQNAAFETGDHKREETEKRFRKHFKEKGLSDTNSRICLLFAKLPDAIERGILYVLKTVTDGKTTIAVYLFGEDVKILDTLSANELQAVDCFPGFPVSEKEIVTISRAQFLILFNKIASICGYVAVDIKKQKNQIHQAVLTVKNQLKNADKAISDRINGFKLMEDLAQLIPMSPVIENFLTCYKEYKAYSEKQIKLDFIHTESCIEQLKKIDVDWIINEKNSNNLRSFKEVLEGILQGLPEGTEAYQKTAAFLCLCNAYRKKSTNCASLVMEAFNLFLEIIQKNTHESKSIETILRKIISHSLLNKLHETTLLNMINIFISKFGLYAQKDCSIWLHEAVEVNNEEIVNLLLKNGADITHKDPQGKTAFFLAAEKKQASLVKALLTYGKVNFKKYQGLLIDFNKNHILHYLLEGEISQEVAQIIETLCLFGATFPLAIAMREQTASLHKLVGALTTEKPVFEIAFSSEHIDEKSIAFRLIMALLQNLNPQEKQQCLQVMYKDETLLNYVLAHYSNRTDLAKEILRLFILENTLMDIDILVTCVKAGQYEVTKFLLARWKNPIDLNHALSNKDTILGFAIALGHVQLTQLILEYKADMRQQVACAFADAAPNAHKGFPNIDEKKLRACLYMTDDFFVGTTVNDGGSFFDSFAQIMNVLEGAPLYTEKLLRDQCYRYYKKNPQVIEKCHNADYGKGVSVPDYDLVRYGKEPLYNGKIIEGRPQIEGVILYKALNLDSTLYVVEVAPNSDDSTELTAAYYAITSNSYQSVRKIDVPDGAPLLALLKNDRHFVPILKKLFVWPMQLAVLKGDFMMLKCLLKYTSKKNMEEYEKEQVQAAFCTAALMGNIEMLKLLNEQIPLPEKYDLFLAVDKAGNTPLNVTIKKNHLACAEWILKTCETHSRNRGEKFSYLDHVLNIPNHMGHLPIMNAIATHNINAVRLLLDSCICSFWDNNQGQKALQLAIMDKNIPEKIIEVIRASKITYCMRLIKTQMEVVLAQDSVHKPFLGTWILRLEKIIGEKNYEKYQERLMSAPMNALQTMAERLAVGIANGIREKYKLEEHKQLLTANQKENIYHVWDQILRTAIDQMMAILSGEVLLQKNRLYTPNFNGTPVSKNDKQRAFTRALKEALRNYFYVSRALYEGKVLMNDEGFNAFKAAFNIASPIATEIGAALTTVNIGVIGGFVSAALELVTRLKDAKYQCEAGRFVQAFGLCQPDAIDKYEKDISIDHDKLKAVAESLYRRYRDQIQQCTVSKEAEISIRLAKTDGIYVLANVMADRIFQHMIKKGSIKTEDDRTITKQALDWFAILGSDNDIYHELSLISLPERCILAVLYECVGDDKDAHVRTDAWLKNGCKTEDIWMAGGILVKTGLKLEQNSNELYIRKGNVAQESLHAKYGYCVVSESMLNLKEIEKRGFVSASLTHMDRFATQLSESDKSVISSCFIS